MIHTGRGGFLSLEGSYHGNSLAGLSIGASDNREQLKNLLPHCGKIAPPLDAKALRSIPTRNANVARKKPRMSAKGYTDVV